MVWTELWLHRGQFESRQELQKHVADELEVKLGFLEAFSQSFEVADGWLFLIGLFEKPLTVYNRRYLVAGSLPAFELLDFAQQLAVGALALDKQVTQDLAVGAPRFERASIGTVWRRGFQAMNLIDGYNRWRVEVPASEAGGGSAFTRLDSH